MRAKKGRGTNPVLCWAGLPDFLQTEGVENGIITAEGVFSNGILFRRRETHEKRRPEH